MTKPTTLKAIRRADAGLSKPRGRPFLPADAPAIERVGWRDFLDDEFEWKQGEHVTLIGPTGLGKTTLALSLLRKRKYVVVFACKPKDPILAQLRKEGYHVTRHWPPPSHVERVVFWPKIERMHDAYAQRDQFRDAIDEIYAQGSWCVYFDEVSYIVKQLGLGWKVEMLWEQGRSLKVSVVATTQRPSWIPLAAYSSATHLFFWRDIDESNLRRMGGISGANSNQVRQAVMRLPRYDALYVNTREERLAITRAPRR